MEICLIGELVRDLFDCLELDLLIAKFNGYEFSLPALKLVPNC